ncbi:hypothetical protein L228DRAFT_240443 [Xylona heveae TC161]|uniref:RRM domain-containing protein n=1 Tax=Xylona heveae (strain CBS 132557 / TC161) TaxID=1328760 RepID=A0A165F7R3_XYLHT|nr:hypothetical protein L228DRAFT_240443 [Xylona heveae TC161]KZF20674.1 hypothetical protein L228DRAFT_240443 [Xylona heveae TC161]
MSSTVLTELDAALHYMQSLKPPGVSGSKINSITALCVTNVQSESVIVQKLYTHFKKTPGTHKLGVLYVVDSVTRQWVDQARKSGEAFGNTVPDGTFAAGVNRVTELLPVLMTDIIQSAPDDQKVRYLMYCSKGRAFCCEDTRKEHLEDRLSAAVDYPVPFQFDEPNLLIPMRVQEKIKKLVDIWERGNTFPAQMLLSFKDKLNAPLPQMVQSTTPEGSPPRDLQQSLNLQQAQPHQQQTQAASAPNTSAILAALANMAKQTPAASSTTPFPPQDSSNNVTNAQNAVPHQVSSSVTQAPLPPIAPPVNMPTSGQVTAPQFPALNSTSQVPATAAPNPLAALATMLPAANPGGGSDILQQQLMLLQGLAQAGIPQEQWGPILGALNQGAAAAAVSATPVPAASNVAPNAWPQAVDPNAWGGRNDMVSRDRNGVAETHIRTPDHQYRRSRSRSPVDWGRSRETPPRRRDSPVYGEYSGDSPARNAQRGDNYDRRGRIKSGRGRGNDYRQRSPPSVRQHRSPSPSRPFDAPPPNMPKWVDYDYTIGQGNIKVLSRTLFVGGVTCSERELREVFSKFGQVQTCIVNTDKRHAFVKMFSRRDAVAAKEGMEHFKSTEMQLRTRWGVGFGPRDCSDYQSGISVIPIDRLTDADRKWMLTAEYGGSGGKQIEGGLSVEEPDIEIGAGVSSKAISRRMATDQGGKNGPRSSRSLQDNTSRYRRNDRHDGSDRDSNPNAIGVPPAVPGFGFQFPSIPGGMPMLPPGFMLPGAAPSQPPPPGHSS